MRDDATSPAHLSRREVLRIAGLTGAWLATPALMANPGARRMPADPAKRFDTDVLVVGGGLAGILAAHRAREAGLRVTVLDKGSVGFSGMSPWAADIADCACTPADVPAALARFAHDSEYLNDQRWTELHLRHAPRVLSELRSWGALDVASLRRAPLLRERLLAAGVQLVERVMVTAFLKDAAGRVAGVIGFRFDDSAHEAEAVVVSARVVVSCMGSGGLRGPGSPIWGLTHDGDALAYAAGARITGKEFVDLHPAFDCAAFVGTPATARPMAQLADPFSASSGMRGLMALEAHFRAMRGDIGREEASHPITGDAVPEGDDAAAVPGASLGLGVYKGEGAVSTNCTGAVDGVPGLYVAGDCLGSMLAGPLPPPAGVSLLASAVQGDLVGRHAATDARATPVSALDAPYLAQSVRALWAARERPEGYSPRWVMHALQNAVMPFFVSYIREERRLLAALGTVTYLRSHCAPRLFAADGHDLRLTHELQHMLLDQEMRLRAALLRRESRGSHYREDFPFRDDANWLCWIDLSRGPDDEMQLQTRAVPVAWRPAGSYASRYPRRFPGEAASRAMGAANDGAPS